MVSSKKIHFLSYFYNIIRKLCILQ